MAHENVIEMRDITKVFGEFVANDKINLQLRKGEIHALLGENGAGKSTLMNMLAGLLEPTSGEIVVNGQVVKLDSPSKAAGLGIGMVHQHFMLVEAFTVAPAISSTPFLVISLPKMIFSATVKASTNIKCW